MALRGEDHSSSKIIRNSLGGMCYKGAGFRARAFYFSRMVAGKIQGLAASLMSWQARQSETEGFASRRSIGMTCPQLSHFS